jgi:hypothetical protein
MRPASGAGEIPLARDGPVPRSTGMCGSGPPPVDRMSPPSTAGEIPLHRDVRRSHCQADLNDRPRNSIKHY